MQQGDIIAGIVVVWFAMTAAGQFHGKCRHADVEVRYPRQSFGGPARNRTRIPRDLSLGNVWNSTASHLFFTVVLKHRHIWITPALGAKKKQVRVCDDCFKTIGDHHVRKLSKSLWYFRVFLRLHVVKLLTSLIARFVVSKYPKIRDFGTVLEGPLPSVPHFFD